MEKEIEQSRGRGSLQKWWVAEDYRIVDGVVIPVGLPDNRWQSYMPFAYPELPAELCKLAKGDEDAILKFVRRRGLLGYTNLAASDSDLYETPMAANLKPQMLHYVRLGGDPIHWIRSHARTVEVVLYLLNSRRESRENYDPEILSSGLEAVWQQFARRETPAHIDYAVGSFFHLESYGIKGDVKKPEEILAAFLREVLQANINYLGEFLLIQDSKQYDHCLCNIVRSKSFPALLPVIYSHLADAAVGDRTYVRCAFCSNYFPQADLRQRYCPHPINPKNESLCSLKARQRRHPVRRTAIQTET